MLAVRFFYVMLLIFYESIYAVKQKILHLTHYGERSSRRQEVNYRLLMRWYRTQVDLQRMYQEKYGRCWRCNQD